MTTATQVHPLALLRDIERRCSQHAQGLPQRKAVKETWTAIAFRVAGVHLVAPLKHVNEILYFPKLTPIPGTQPWMKGVANVRGTLLPIMDLQDYLGQGAITRRTKSRVLVVRQEDLAVGLLVDEVLGLKYFRDDEQILAKTQIVESLRRYVQGTYSQAGLTWHVVSLHALANAPEFYKVAV